MAGEPNLSLHVKDYSHIFKVRRVAIGQKLDWRNLKDSNLYTYEIESITKKEAILKLINIKETKDISTCNLHVGWCVVEPKTIEKNIAMLNEMGVKKVTFVYADFSQKNYKIDEERLRRILINSSEQSGRSILMELEVLNSVQEYLEKYPCSAIIDFSQNYLSQDVEVSNFLVGPEGGFSEEERKLFEKRKIFGLKSTNILKSETAVVGVCAKIIL